MVIFNEYESEKLNDNKIADLSHHCKFSDCTHTNEIGCAVLDALDAGKLSEAVFENYLKLKREQAHFSSTVAEKKHKGKELGKLIKAAKKPIRVTAYSTLPPLRFEVVYSRTLPL